MEGGDAQAVGEGGELLGVDFGGEALDAEIAGVDFEVGGGVVGGGVLIIAEVGAVGGADVD